MANSPLPRPDLHRLDTQPYGLRSNQSIRQYANDVQALVEPLRPVLVYLRQVGADQAAPWFAKVCRWRGEQWTAYVVRAITDCPYARARGLTGLQGAIQFIGDYARVIEELLPLLPVPRLTLDVAQGDWPSRFQQIEAFLAI